MTNKISKGHAFAMLIIISAFGMICISSAYSAGQMTGIFISAIFQAVAVIPSVYLYSVKKFSIEKCPKWILTLYTLYFLLYGGFSFSRFYTAARSMNFPITNKVFALVLIAGVCLYSAMLGIKPLSRGSAIVLAFFAVSIAVLFIGSYSKISLDRFKVPDNTDILSSGFADFIFGGEIAVMFILFSFMDKNYKGLAYSFISVKLLIAEFISFIGVSVLGSLSGIVEYPFFAIGAYSQPFSVQRADGIYIMLFTILCAVSIIFYITIASILIKLIFPKFRYNETAVTASMLLLSLIFSYTESIAGWIWTAFAVILYIIVPFYLIGSDKFEKKHN